MERNRMAIIWKNRTLLILGLWIGVFIVNQANAQELEQSLLWKVEGDSIETSYLFGTFHLLPESDFELKDKVAQAFDAAEHVVMELDMDNPSMQAELMQNAFMTDGQSLDKLLTKEEFESLDAYMMETANISLIQVNRFKPFFVSAMIIPSLIVGTPASYEMTFVQRALNTNKEILGLETPKEQLKAFDGISYEKQVKELMRVTTEQKEMASLFKTMIKNYKKENITKMYDLVVENMTDESQVKSLLTDRNIDWVPKIGEFARDKATFFAVGAGHLGGETGMIQLLRAAGYTLTPIME